MFPGVAVAFTAERRYPFGDTAAQVLGYVGDIDAPELKAMAKDGYNASDVIGQSGVEGSYERWLRGTPGSQVIKVDALGNPVGVVSTSNPVSGDDVVLNVDVKLQQLVENTLDRPVAKLEAHNRRADSGAAVVLDPQTGAVLAMASVPTYNPSWWVGGISDAHFNLLKSAAKHRPLTNRAIDGLWAPGSTSSRRTTTAALNDGLLTAGSVINDPGSYQIKAPCSGVCTYYDNTNNGQHEAGLGMIDVTTALTASDDVFFYTLGADYWYDAAKYGQTPIQKVAGQYGFGQPTGVDLPGSPPARWTAHGCARSSSLSTRRTSEEAVLRHRRQHRDGLRAGRDGCHPLQVATAYATFANGGTRYAPQMVNSIVSPAGKVVEQFKPRVTGHVPLPASTYDPILAGLEGVIYSSDPHDLGTAYGTFQATGGCRWRARPARPPRARSRASAAERRGSSPSARHHLRRRATSWPSSSTRRVTAPHVRGSGRPADLRISLSPSRSVPRTSVRRRTLPDARSGNCGAVVGIGRTW